MVQGIEIITT